MVMSLCCLWRKFWRWRSLHSFASVPRPLTLYGLWNLIAGRVLGSFRNRPSPFAITLLSLHGFLLGLLSRVFLDDGPYLLGVFFFNFFYKGWLPQTTNDLYNLNNRLQLLVPMQNPMCVVATTCRLTCNQLQRQIMKGGPLHLVTWSHTVTWNSLVMDAPWLHPPQ